jgi:hypothetical protein
MRGGMWGLFRKSERPVKIRISAFLQDIKSITRYARAYSTGEWSS